MIRIDKILKVGSAKTIAAPHGWPDAAEQCCGRDHALRSPRRWILAQCRSRRRCRRCRHGALAPVRWLAASGLSLGFYRDRSPTPSQSPHAGILLLVVFLLLHFVGTEGCLLIACSLLFYSSVVFIISRF